MFMNWAHQLLFNKCQLKLHFAIFERNIYNSDGLIFIIARIELIFQLIFIKYNGIFIFYSLFIFAN